MVAIFYITAVRALAWYLMTRWLFCSLKTDVWGINMQWWWNVSFNYFYYWLMHRWFVINSFANYIRKCENCGKRFSFLSDQHVFPKQLLSNQKAKIPKLSMYRQKWTTENPKVYDWLLKWLQRGRCSYHNQAQMFFMQFWFQLLYLVDQSADELGLKNVT